MEDFDEIVFGESTDAIDDENKWLGDLSLHINSADEKPDLGVPTEGKEIPKPMLEKKTKDKSSALPHDAGETNVSSSSNAAIFENRCQFECLWCFRFETSSFTKLSTHIRQTHFHGSSYRHLFEKDAEAYAKKLVLYECFLCRRFVAYDRQTIGGHLKSCYKILHPHASGKSLRQILLQDDITPKKHTKGFKNCKVWLKLSRYVEHAKANILKDCTSKIHPPLRLGKRGIDALPPEETTFEVSNLCSFSCTTCLATFLSYTTFHGHKRKCLGRGKFVNECLHEARYHRCRLCLGVLICDVFFIRQHVMKVHKKTISEYRFVKPKATNPFVLKSLVSPLPQKYRLKTPILRKSEYNEVPMECISFENENLCLFSCDKCDKETSSWSKMVRHLSLCKGSQVFREHYVKEARLFQCKLCKARMICDKYITARHFKQSHKLTPEKYKEATTGLLPNLLQKNPIKDWSTTFSGKIPSVSPPLPKVTNKPGSLPDHLVTQEVGDFCSFACCICGYETRIMTNLKEHNRATHAKNRLKSLYPRSIKVARYHKCKLCSLILLCNLSVIKQHALASHFMPLDDYRTAKAGSKFMKEPPMSVTPVPVDALEKIPCVNICSFRFTTFKRSLLDSTRLMSMVGNGCVFRCKLCKHNSTSWPDLNNHVSCVHREFIPGFDSNYVQKAKLHECKICSRRVLCDLWMIAKHLHLKHHIKSLDDYLNQT